MHRLLVAVEAHGRKVAARAAPASSMKAARMAMAEKAVAKLVLKAGCTPG